MATEANKIDRKPTGAAGTDSISDTGECPICLESFSSGTLCTLPCKHIFHGACVEELRKQGVQQASPLCRIALPPGPEQLFEDATCLYVKMAARQGGFRVSWEPRTPTDKEKMVQAVAMWTNAANQGHLRANCSIGHVYEIGSGVTQDYNEAARWFRKAADQGNVEAQCKLGALLCDGKGVTQDYNEAAQWYRKAADQGDAGAQFSLEVTYFHQS